VADVQVRECFQLCVVVRDLQASLETYVHRYGIGPWEIYEFNGSTVDELKEGGEPVDAAWRLALARVGGLFWELIEPLDDRSTYARFLAQHGEGVHHVAVGVENFDGAVDSLAARGRQLELSGSYKGVSFAYLPTQPDLGVTLEIFRSLPEGQQPDAVYP
jgi:methylmalonyl-CoA/ethylmalonyl-CoA epimerase